MPEVTSTKPQENVQPIDQGAAATVAKKEEPKKGTAYGFNVTLHKAIGRIGHALEPIIDIFRSKGERLARKEQRLLDKINNPETTNKKTVESDLKVVQASIKQFNQSLLESRSVGQKLSELDKAIDVITKEIVESKGIDKNVVRELHFLKTHLQELEKTAFADMKKQPKVGKHWLKVNENMKKAELTLLREELLLEKGELQKALDFPGLKNKDAVQERLEEINKQLGIVQFNLKPIVKQFVEKLHDREKLLAAIDKEGRQKEPDDSLIAAYRRNLVILDKEIDAITTKWNTLYDKGEVKPTARYREKGAAPAEEEEYKIPSPLDIKKRAAPESTAERKAKLQKVMAQSSDQVKEQQVAEAEAGPVGGPAISSSAPPPPPMPGKGKVVVKKFEGEPDAEPNLAVSPRKGEEGKFVEEKTTIEAYLKQMNAALNSVREDVARFEALTSEIKDAEVGLRQHEKLAAEYQEVNDFLDEKIKAKVPYVEFDYVESKRSYTIPMYSDTAFPKASDDFRAAKARPLYHKLQIDEAKAHFKEYLAEETKEVAKGREEIESKKKEIEQLKKKANNKIPFADWAKVLKTREELVKKWDRALAYRQPKEKPVVEKLEEKKEKKPAAVPGSLEQKHPELETLAGDPANLVAMLKTQSPEEFYRKLRIHRSDFGQKS